MTVTPEELEQTVLGSLTSLDMIRRAQALGIVDDAFQVDAHAEAWRYITELAAQGKVATRGDIRVATGVVVPTDVSDVDTFTEELLRRQAARLTQRSLLQYSRQLDADPYSAIHSIVSDLQAITKTHVGHTETWDADAKSRLATYEERADRRDRGEVIGIPTGLDIFDREGQGWQPGEMAVVLGALNAGKSWLVLYFAAVAYAKANKRVLILSPESTIRDVELRMDSLVGNMLGYTISNRGLRYGTLSADEKTQYAKFLGEVDLAGRQDFVVRDSGERGVFTTEDVISHAREHRPDLLVIDGFHLLRDGGKSWENVSDAAAAIKGLAQEMGMAVVAGSQVRRDSVVASEDVPDVGDAGYGMGHIETANRVIGMGETRGNKFQRIFKIRKSRDGDKLNTRYYLRFNVDIGDVGQHYPNADRETGEVEF